VTDCLGNHVAESCEILASCLKGSSSYIPVIPWNFTQTPTSKTAPLHICEQPNSTWRERRRDVIICSESSEAHFLKCKLGILRTTFLLRYVSIHDEAFVIWRLPCFVGQADWIQDLIAQIVDLKLENKELKEKTEQMSEYHEIVAKYYEAVSKEYRRFITDISDCFAICIGPR
jgi:hypothetical protein